jgi:hypothetical protein
MSVLTAHTASGQARAQRGERSTTDWAGEHAATPEQVDEPQRAPLQAGWHGLYDTGVSSLCLSQISRPSYKPLPHPHQPGGVRTADR